MLYYLFFANHKNIQFNFYLLITKELVENLSTNEARMNKFEHKLKHLLRKEASFVDKTGELLSDVVCDSAWKLDHNP